MLIPTKGQKGFTLVEIAIVLVIIGLLLGGILKGQELINSARVRNMADLNAGVQAAYYGFIDRYRMVPGDAGSAEAKVAVGATAVNAGGDGNGRLDDSTGDEFMEAIAVWEHLSKAGFISGSFEGADGATPDATNYPDDAPENAFNGPIILFITSAYEGGGPPKLSLNMGENVPVTIARELDVKLDDGTADTGVARAAFDDASAGTAPAFAFGNLATVPVAAGSPGACVDGAGEWNTADNAQDCNILFLY
jgi:prepilin-type N-terminal cleavage/methylation domain-containing protein